jgi:drug/metabolite transporter (DMT)-like permease
MQGPACRAEEDPGMSMRKILGIVLLAAGILALVYRGFTYTRETHKADLGPIEFQIKDRERVQIPVWAGVTLAVAGGALLVIGRR